MASDSGKHRPGPGRRVSLSASRKARLLILCQSDIQKASSRVRGFQLVEPLVSEGVEVRISSATGLRGESGGSPRRRFLRQRFTKTLRRDLDWADVVLAQRLVKVSTVLNLVHDCAKPIIYDFDDALYERPRDGEGRLIGHKGRIANSESDPAADSDWLAQLQWFRKLLDRAALCTVTNPNLARWVRDHYPGKEVVEIPGPIDIERFTPGLPGAQKNVIGWIGNASTTPYLKVAARAIGAVRESHPDWELWLVGAKPRTVESLGIAGRVIPWSLESEAELLQQFAIGIQPLPDDPWSRGKGGYKLLQYMAAGLPAVSSPVAINCTLVDVGRTGFLAADEAQWIECLEKLIEDPELRLALGKNARAKVETQYSLRRAAALLASLVRELAERGTIET